MLMRLHRQSGIPDGQFPQRPAFWRGFTDNWNGITGRQDTPEELLHYIMTQRKQALWFRFDGTHKPKATPPDDLLSQEEWSVAERIYGELGAASDNLLVDATTRAELVKRFVAATGQHVPELEFVAALVARRKSGWLPKLAQTGSEDLGFNDFDEVAEG
ncbi:MAG: hypothetical protein U0572_01065 [Phycisphaerales bacterium]